jgi:dTDP-4-dehydrorhamnose 3,5-epimerase
MQIEPLQSAQGLRIEGPLLITPRAFGDDRGWFFESWNQNNFNEAAGETVMFSQDNHSRSTRGVLRGLHYQLGPEPQAKLVRASLGTIFDVTVDIRRSSPTFGQWVGAILSAENKQQLWVPEGFAHGFLTLSDVAEVQYKTRGFWNKGCERAIRWDDPELAIHWPLDQLERVAVSLSEKDAAAPSFKAADSAGDVFQ